MTEPTANKDFAYGDRAWTRDGVKVHVDAKTTEGLYVVSPFLDIGAYDPEEGPAEDATGTMAIVDELFADPPVQFVHQEIADAKADLKRVRDEVARELQHLHGAQAERRRLVDKLKDIPALQHIERILDGKMRFVVVERYGEPKVMTIEEAQKTDGWRSERRMITLTTAKEGAAWAINTYHDGSGSDQKVWFFQTEEEAKAEVIDILSFKVGEAYDRFRGDSNGRVYASTIIGHADALVAAGGTLPGVIAAALKAIRREAAQQAIANNQKHAETYLKGIAEAQAVIDELDQEKSS